jgi:small subunit ribosomal protein S1
VLSIGQTVRVKVLDIDRERQRISLGLKQTQEDPWQRVVDTYKPGDTLSGKVTKVVAFGAFVEIVPGVEGLVHISELAEHHVEAPGEVVQPGDETRVKILEVDEERRRVSLSIKRVGEGGMPLRDAFEAAQATAEPEQQAAAEPEQQATAEPEQQAAAEPEQQAAAEPEQQAPAEPEQQAAAEPEQQAAAEPEQQAAAEPEPGPPEEVFVESPTGDTGDADGAGAGEESA